MRDPEWNNRKEVCHLLMSSDDARNLKVQTGDEVWLTTEASSAKVPVAADIPPVRHGRFAPRVWSLL